MLETVRQYAREKLEGSGEAQEVQSRHAAWFLALAEEAGPLMMIREQFGWAVRGASSTTSVQPCVSFPTAKTPTGR
jgi:predicted ATPase